MSDEKAIKQLQSSFWKYYNWTAIPEKITDVSKGISDELDLLYFSF